MRKQIRARLFRELEAMFRKHGFERRAGPDKDSLFVSLAREAGPIRGVWVTPVDETDSFEIDVVWNEDSTFPRGQRCFSGAEAERVEAGILRAGELSKPGDWASQTWKLYEEPDLLNLPPSDWPEPLSVSEVEKRIPAIVGEVERDLIEYVMPFLGAL